LQVEIHFAMFVVLRDLATLPPAFSMCDGLRFGVSGCRLLFGLGA
jgi:hypothetical protein